MPNKDAKTGLLSIGEFSKFTRASIKSLRYYERVGVLKPAYVDPETHYRYYSVQQIFRIGFIRICVEEGLPLEELDHFLADDDILKASEFFSHISELANKRWRQSYETMLRMHAYQKEYERQIALKTEAIKTYCPDEEEALITVPFDMDVERFSYAHYTGKISRLFRFAHERRIVSLAKQGLYRDDDGRWLVYMQVFDDPDLERNLDDADDIGLVRSKPLTYVVNNVYDEDIDACFRKAAASKPHRTIRFVSEGWAYSLVTGMYTVDVLHTK